MSVQEPKNKMVVPETVEPRVALTLQRLEELQKGSRSGPEIDPMLLIPSQNPGVLSILGEQGVGKSTTLKYICEALKGAPEKLVTPVVSPERFAEGDTLFGWVLSAMTDLLPERFPDSAERMASEIRPNLSLHELADLLRRQEALARKHHQVSAVLRSAHADEWANSMAAVTTAGLQLGRGWVALLNGLSAEIEQIVIPVDDADQVPSLLGEILRDLRWLTVHPMVATIVCANEEMLLQSLFGDPELAVMEASTRRRHSVGVLTKALPRHLRISVQPLGPAERLHFRPQDGSETLRELLGHCLLSDPPAFALDSLGDLFELRFGDAPTTSPYADMLPERPRQLDHLWRQLRNIVHGAERSDDDIAALAARQLIETAIGSAADLNPNLPKNTIRIFEADAQGPSLEFDYSKIESAHSMGAGRTLHRSEAQEVTIRRIDGFPLKLLLDQEDTQDRAKTENLPSSFSLAHYFASDLTDPAGSNKAPFFLWGSNNRIARRGGFNWEGSLEVEHQSERTDNRFALIPDWEARFDYFLYAAGWNACWNVVKDHGPSPSRTLLEWVLLKHLHLVVGIHEKRAIPGDFAESLRPQVEALDANWSLENGLDEFAGAVERLYKPGSKKSVREGDFNNWIEILLPSMADEILGVPAFAQKLLEIRQSVLKEHDALQAANLKCAEFLGQRVRRRISADWTTSTIALIEKFDSSLANRMHELHEVAREESDSDQKALAAALEKRGVSETVTGELFLSGMTPELERKLRLAGLPEPAIELVAQRFRPSHHPDISPAQSKS